MIKLPQPLVLMAQVRSQVSSITSAGSGYSSAPTVTVVGGPHFGKAH